MDKDSFTRILALIENDPVFHNRSHVKQAPPAVQLGVTLYRLGGFGWGSSAFRLSFTLGIGDGTVQLYMSRCFTALLRLYSNTIIWPREQAQEDVIRRFEEVSEGAFENCAGILDGTVINLETKPSIQGYAYFHRKRRYGLNCQAVCDADYRFLYICVGYPASVHDSTIFKETALSLQPARFFDDVDSFLIADKAYQLTPRLLTPYKDPTGQRVEGGYRLYNQKHAKLRIRVERAFGILKGRFGSLKCLSIRLDSDEAITRAITWITCTFILHNMLMPMDGGEGWVDDDVLGIHEPGAMNEGDRYAQGDIARTRVRERILRQFG
jgi:hypothetical protein